MPGAEPGALSEPKPAIIINEAASELLRFRQWVPHDYSSSTRADLLALELWYVAATMLSTVGFDLISLNMQCPLSQDLRIVWKL